MTEKYKFGDRIEYSVASRSRSQQAVKVKGLEVHSLNKDGGYQSRMVGLDFKPGWTYVLEKRTFWWILVGKRRA